MLVGDKIVCIDLKNLSINCHLKLNKVYTVKRFDSHIGVLLKEHDGYYWIQRFITLKEYRINKLKQIL